MALDGDVCPHPRKHLQRWKHFDSVGAEARDASKHPAIPRAAPTSNCPAPNVSSAEAEKPRSELYMWRASWKCSNEPPSCMCGPSPSEGACCTLGSLVEKPPGVAAAGGAFYRQGATTLAPRRWPSLNQHYKLLGQDSGNVQGDSSSWGGMRIRRLCA